MHKVSWWIYPYPHKVIRTYIKLLLGLRETSAIDGINDEDHAIDTGGEVISPQLSGCTARRQHKDNQTNKNVHVKCARN